MAFELVQHLNDWDRKMAARWCGPSAAANRRPPIPPPPAVRVQEQEVLDAALRFKVPLVERWMRGKIVA